MVFVCVKYHVMDRYQLVLERGHLGCDIIPSSDLRGKWNAT